MLFAVAALALVFFGLVATAALEDARSFTIPNWISLTLAAAFPLATMAVGMPLQTVALNVAAGLAALVIGMVMFALRWVGGGDAKLFAAVSLWLGWVAIPTFVVATALAGGGLAVLLLSVRSAPLRPIVLLGPSWVVRLAEPGEGIPYGVAIAIGAIAAFPLTLFGASLGL